MKVVQEEPYDDGKKIITNALAYSPNPNQLSKELYELALATENEDQYIETPVESAGEREVEANSDKIAPIPDLSEEGLSETSLGSTIDNSGHSEASEVESENEDDELALSDGLTSFSEWLLSLEKTDPGAEGNGENSEFASEALAGLLAKQGHIDKALQMYEQLALIYPEKSTYFAAQIQNLRGS